MKHIITNSLLGTDDCVQEGCNKNQKNQMSKAKETTLSQDIMTLLIRVAFIASILLILFAFVFHSFRYNDLSMQPSIIPGDLATSYRLDKRYCAGDVVAFTFRDELTCGRVIAVAGDTVDIDKDGLVVNGSHQYEPRITKETTQVKDGVTFPLVVPEGGVFVLGDNRDQAVDSRIIGCLEIDKTEGKLISIFRRRGL